MCCSAKGATAEVPAVAIDSLTISSCRILLIEDHLDTATLMRRVLVRRGYHVVVAASLAEARVRSVPHRLDGGAAGDSGVEGEGSPRFEPGAAFEGEAWLAPSARAPHFLLGGLAVMLSHRLGGGVLHAASVEFDGGVVAFVGPSGAGKSTACRHMAGAPLVSVDRHGEDSPIGPIARKASVAASRTTGS